jgi:hypothetical protein
MTLRLLFAGSCVVSAAALSGAYADALERPALTDVQACKARGPGTLVSERLRVRARGEIPGCDDDRAATGAFLLVDGLLESIHPSLRPGPVTIELRQAGDRFDVTPDKRVISVSARFASADAAAWLHELAHLAAHGPRPRAPAARRIASAIDEGIADYFAAALTGSPRVGDGLGEMRDLTRPPPLPADTWGMLALGELDPHLFGWKLAALLWRAEPRAGGLLEDWVRCLSGGVLEGAESPAAVLGALAQSCPARSRELLSSTLRDWAPAELFAPWTPSPKEVP